MLVAVIMLVAVVLVAMVFMSVVLVFMGSPQRVKNPHQRAELAEMLAALLPSPDDSQTMFK